MRAVASQPRNRSQRGSLSCRWLLPHTANIIAAMIGTDTMPFNTAAQNSIAMGSMSVMARAAPPSVANIMGHTFKKGRRVRLALSPSFYPTLWASPEPVTIMLKARRRRLPAGKRAYPSRPRGTGRGQAGAKAAADEVGGALRQSRRLFPCHCSRPGRRDDAEGLSRHDQRQACSTAAATNTAECSREYGSIFRRRRISRWSPILCRSPASPRRPRSSNAPI